MKKIKQIKYLCLMFIPLFLIALLSPMNAFASQTGNGMKIHAYIEAHSEKPSSSSNIDSDPEFPPADNNISSQPGGDVSSEPESNVSSEPESNVDSETGGNNRLILWAFLLLTGFGALVIIIVYRKRKINSKIKHNSA